MILLDGYQGFIDSIKYYGTLIVLLSIIFICWAKVNLYRFNNVERRQGRTPIIPAYQAEYYRIHEQGIVEWQSFKHAVIHHDDLGFPILTREVQTDKQASDLTINL